MEGYVVYIFYYEGTMVIIFRSWDYVQGDELFICLYIFLRGGGGGGGLIF